MKNNLNFPFFLCTASFTLFQPSTYFSLKIPADPGNASDLESIFAHSVNINPAPAL